MSVSTRKRRRERGPARAQLPVPLSNLTKLSKRGALHPAQTKVPLRFSLSSGEERGGSVPPSCAGQSPGRASELSPTRSASGTCSPPHGPLQTMR